MECSNNGVCDRRVGQCKCFPGHEGPACQRLICPGNPVCSGQGMCFNLNQLAKSTRALPMIGSLFRYDHMDSTTQHPNIAWDDNFGHACICDSSWPVGLEAGETQQAEYFGLACDKRHCPSGDNPATLNIDETNCTGIAIYPHGGVGKPGNLCHVDCSNNGVCDYDTGICKCDPGFIGSNCGKIAFR